MLAQKKADDPNYEVKKSHIDLTDHKALWYFLHQMKQFLEIM